MANICSVTMYFYGEKSAVEDLHAKCQRWMNTGGKATKLLSALNINKEGLDLRCEACYVGELFVGPTGDRTFVLDELFKQQFTETEDVRQFVAVYADEHPEKYISLNEFVEY